MDTLNSLLPIKERLDKLKKRIQESDFLEGKGLSNEVNIHICCYKPEEEMIVRHFTEQLIGDQSLKCQITEYNLYHTFLEICDEKRITSSISSIEIKKGKEYLLKQLQQLANNTSFVNKMRHEKQTDNEVIFITGVGEVFPFLRIHSLLDAMQPCFEDTPIVVFYPGKFDGRTVQLFEKLKPNSYYRAFNVI